MTTTNNGIGRAQRKSLANEIDRLVLMQLRELRLKPADLAPDPRFSTRAARVQNREAVQQLLDEIFIQGTRKEWLARLQAHDVPCGPISTLDEVVEDSQVLHLGMVREVLHPTEGKLRVIGSGVALGSTPLQLSAAPVLDEHRDEILADLGLPTDYLSNPVQRSPAT